MKLSPAPVSTFKRCQVGLGGSLLNHDLAILLVTFLGWRIRDPSSNCWIKLGHFESSRLWVFAAIRCPYTLNMHVIHQNPQRYWPMDVKKVISINLPNYAKWLQVALVLPICLLGKVFQYNKHFQKDGPALDFKNDGHIPLSKPLRK